jgi:hypothetical protein
VRKHGGTLRIACPEGGGTTVTIRFPFRNSVHPTGGVLPEPTTAESAASQRQLERG